MNQYKKNPNLTIIAVQLNLDTPGLIYTKWGALQRAKPGDWLVNNEGECYSIDNETFQLTYKQVSKGLYFKTGSVWAEKALKEGFIKTKEGNSHYEAGDMLVYNNKDKTDGYCMSATKFEKMYILDVNDPSLFLKTAVLQAQSVLDSVER